MKGRRSCGLGSRGTHRWHRGPPAPTRLEWPPREHGGVGGQDGAQPLCSRSSSLPGAESGGSRTGPRKLKALARPKLRAAAVLICIQLRNREARAFTRPSGPRQAPASYLL